jgi:glycosyltransferase involved in cell wall biosynthesis
MKIAICVDSEKWAIGKLALAKVKHNPHHTFKYIVLHPRDAGEASFQQSFVDAINEFKPDIIHFEYYRTASQILIAKPELKQYKIILTHHNQREKKALLSADWEGIGVNLNITHTEKAKKVLMEKGKQKNVEVIKHGIDTDLFTYSEEEPEEFTVGYVGRIVPWKRLGDIAKACRELGVPLLFMGKRDKDDYWFSIPEEDRQSINFSFMDCNDAERKDFYRELSCYVSFSDDEYEEGPLSFFESMHSGVPVITTPNGSAAEIARDSDNSLVVPFGDVQALKDAILRMKNEPELRKQLRRNAWESIKNYHERKMAYDYSLAYHKVKGGESSLVSVILPTYNRKEQVLKILERVKEQTYPNVEIVIADDGSDEENFMEDILKFKRENPDVTIKIVHTGNEIYRQQGKDVYGLAKARNLAVCEAEGKYLLFLDSRILPAVDAIEDFVRYTEAQQKIAKQLKVWLFGNKGSDKASFVENFSFVDRSAFIRFGMFNERIDKYGGMSQEIRTRWMKEFEREIKYVSDITAEQMIGSKRTDKRRKDIIDMKFLLFRLYGLDR